MHQRERVSGEAHMRFVKKKKQTIFETRNFAHQKRINLDYFRQKVKQRKGIGIPIFIKIELNV